MSAIVFVELVEGKVKKSSLEAVTYAASVGSVVSAIVIGALSGEESARLGQAGATKVLNVVDEKLASNNIMAYASMIAEAFDKEGASLLVMAKSSLGDPVSARVAIKTGAALASNVCELPDTSSGFKVKSSIYTGKAFAISEMKAAKKILVLRKNAVEIKEDGGAPQMETFSPVIHDVDFKVKVTSTEKATGEVLLPEADIVVSGGRGLKGPENWGMIVELAKTLGAATGCSKPVSDMDWRPHHEHVGQTGIKVSPSLYIAVGISGAIQHLAGVNSSKYILVVNKDPEAPFFKAADYGVVGDAFDVIPKLTEAIKAQQG
ncbi:MAG: electron transfer flavoprotein alpha subunit [Cyclobacteriaceae bacterium]|jgi:electron transfer flavoprotein alpha subunit